MKRSEINSALLWAKNLFEQYSINLPAFGYWSIDEWKEHKDQLDTILQTRLGWDITDYGNDDFQTLGSVLFTLRNGVIGKKDVGTPYAEKLIPLYEGQRLPCHYHASKTEDIIVRAGGVMNIRLFNAKQDDKSVDTNTPVTVFMDGIKHTVDAGEKILIHPGSSITLTPYMYHLFGSEQGYGDVVIGEVSAINDDNSDNYFSESVSRFSQIEEDVPILHPLCNEYDRLF